MKLLLLCFGVVAGIDSIISFNMQCDATFYLFAGTPAEGAFALNRVPFQFVRSLARVMQARVAAVPGCSSFGNLDTNYPATSTYSQLFGLESINFMRFLDAADTTAQNAQFPANCNSSEFAFDWQQIRQHFAGINLPSTCSAANFYPNGCLAKWTVVTGFDIEIAFKDTCTSVAQNGYRLPQVELRCSGPLCNTFGRPCLTNSDCGGTVTCDSVNVMLDNPLGFLSNVGLFNLQTDNATCGPTGPNNITFTEAFFSKVINNIANLLGYTTTPDTKQWHQLSLCAAAEFQNKYFPSSAPTPSGMFVCQNGTQISPNEVCNGVPDCGMGEDEPPGHCTCGFGFISSFQCNCTCCSVCSTDPNCGSTPGSFGSNQCSNPNSNNGPQICNQDSTTKIVTCPDLGPSTGATGTVTYPNLTSVVNPDASTHALLWADCLGNIQIGNPDDIVVVNLLTPLHQIAARLENIISTSEGCRIGADTSNSYLRDNFYVWGVSFFGGIFFDTLSATTGYGGYTPGAMADNSTRWYASASNNTNTTNGTVYFVNPPFANLQNQWSTCNLNTITGANHICQINAQIQSWFAGPGFPSSWGTLAATLQASIASNCNVPLPLGSYQGDALPEVYVTCEGLCTGTSPNATDTGCCMMRRPLIVLTAANPTCPPGYTSQVINSSITNFLFVNCYEPLSSDTTLINFLQLLAAHAVDFTGDPTFVDPTIGGPTSICIINGSGFGNNLGAWGNTTYTENCPVPYVAPGNGSNGCPQILSTAPVVACGTPGQLPCVTPPTGNTCPTNGCGAGPTPAPLCPGPFCTQSGGFWVGPALFTMLIPIVI